MGNTKKAALLAGALLGLTALSAPASARTAAVGIGITSSGSGLSVATQEPAGAFAQATLGIGYHSFLLNADYLFTAPLGTGVNWYAGPGLTLRSYGAGVRVPFGLSAEFVRVPLQLGVELAPTLAGFGGFIDLAVHARFVVR